MSGERDNSIDEGCCALDERLKSKEMERDFMSEVSKTITIEQIYRRMEEIDWDFKGADTLYLTHCYHSYPARFIPQIPRTVIESFTNMKDVVLDPFCGCGTTLVESVLLDRKAVGIDINPIGALITKVKTTIIKPETLYEYYNSLIDPITSIIMQTRGEKTLTLEPIPKFKIPKMPKRKLSKKFTPEIKRELACIKAKIMEINGEDVRDFFMVALSSTIRTVVESRSKNIDVLSIFLDDVKLMVRRMLEFYKVCHKHYERPKIYCADSRKMWFIEDESIDLIVTSPSYVNAYDYNREHMFDIFWLHDYLCKKFKIDFKTFKKNELGAHSHYICNRFLMVAEYFDGLYRCFQHMNRVLKDGKTCCVVIGDSTVEGEYIRTHEYFKEIAKELGFEVKADVLRNIDVDRKYLSKTIGKINQEHVLFFRKTRNNSELGDPIQYVENLLKRLLKSCKEKNKEKISNALEEFRKIVG